MNSAETGAIQKFRQNESLVAHVAFKDGRLLELPTTVAAPRPRVTLLSKSVQRPSTGESPIHLSSQEDLPIDGRLSFFLKSQVPEEFTPTEKIEVATAENGFSTILSEADGSVTLQDAHTMYVVFDPMKRFGAGAFGPIRYRPVNADGVAGDWQPLANLVRLPAIRDIRCSAANDQSCVLSGSNLFLIDTVASDSQFQEALSVPEGFLESSLGVPRPKGTKLYIKLRDDPTTVNELSVSELGIVQAEQR